jgi:hypothetical protein
VETRIRKVSKRLDRTRPQGFPERPAGLPAPSATCRPGELNTPRARCLTPKFLLTIAGQHQHQLWMHDSVLL